MNADTTLNTSDQVSSGAPAEKSSKLSFLQEIIRRNSIPAPKTARVPFADAASLIACAVTVFFAYQFLAKSYSWNEVFHYAYFLAMGVLLAWAFLKHSVENTTSEEVEK